MQTTYKPTSSNFISCPMRETRVGVAQELQNEGNEQELLSAYFSMVQGHSEKGDYTFFPTTLLYNCMTRILANTEQSIASGSRFSNTETRASTAESTISRSTRLNSFS